MSGVRAQEVVVADERRLRDFGKVGIISEALKLRLVQDGPEEAELEKGVSSCG